jgi:hypothetical protein
MNKRIKELEPQCWEHNEFGLNFNYEKFAELIVAESAAEIDRLKKEVEELQQLLKSK